MKISTILKNKIIRGILIAFVWLALWETVSRAVNNNILMAGPADVINCLFVKITEAEFWIDISGSLINIAKGFFIGLTAGILFAFLSYKSGLIKAFVTPFMAFLKAAPVAAFIVLFLIWWHSDILSVAVSACIVLPQIYTGLLEGLSATDDKLIKMADSYGIGRVDRFHYIYRPQIEPYMKSALKMSAGMAWKSGIAAEVIGTPDGSIGESLYMSKIYLDTEGVLVWTLVIIVLSIVCENLMLKAYDLYNRIEPSCFGSRKRNLGAKRIELSGICKQYDGKTVLSDFTAEYGAGCMVTLDWKSGAGKTTLFKIISKETKADEGNVLGDYESSVLFQEDRLCENFSAIKNVEMVTGDRKKAREELLKVLTEDDISKPVSKLSGGQKRRVALVRALACDADVYLLDEPFNGLDAETRSTAGKYIENKLKDKIVLIASHIEESTALEE